MSAITLSRALKLSGGLYLMQLRNRRVLGALQPDTSAPEPNATAHSEETDEPWCLCRQPQGSRFMIECDIRGNGCYQWYHGNCVGITAMLGGEMERNNEQFVCPQCAPPTDATGPDICLPTLPPPESSSEMHFAWNDTISGEVFTRKILSAYDAVVHWRNNLFQVPSGPIGTRFLTELARLYNAYGLCTAMERVALYAAMVFPALILQNSHPRSRPRDHVRCVKHRLALWEEGSIDELLSEGNTIQKHLRSSRFNQTDTARRFAHLMFSGKVKSALNLLSNESRGSMLSLSTPLQDSSVFEELVKKHPQPTPVVPDALFAPDSPLPSPCHPVVFDRLDGVMIREVALHIDGAAGPSGVDAASWRRMCTSFGNASSDLCLALAAVARRISGHLVDPGPLRPLLNSRLIALDKNPGVRPIGIGETSRRIIARAVLRIVQQDVVEAAGCVQLCAGQEAGSEAAVHAIRDFHSTPDSEGILLVDATNAFNSLNRQAALMNMYHLCPSLATILTNTYRDPTALFIDGTSLMSQEGCTQGDPLAMPMYAISVMPLIRKLDDLVFQVWFADDAGGCGKLSQLHRWWTSINQLGPAYGYYPNSKKTWLVVKEEFLDDAKSLFANSGVQITTKGRPYLGAAIGTDQFIKEHTVTKVQEWVHGLDQLAAFAESQPHAAYSALTHGFISKWQYYCRTTPGISVYLEPLELAIRTKFLPTLTPHLLSDEERDVIGLPARLGGLGIDNPVQLAPRCCDFSRSVTAPLVQSITEQSFFFSTDVAAAQTSAKSRMLRLQRQFLQDTANSVLDHASPALKRCILYAQQKGASSWLSALPIEKHGFALHKQAFRDAICIRYSWTPPRLPSHCICGKVFSMDHAFSCPCGAFPTIRHNDIRNLTATLLTEVCHGVCVEPHLLPLTGESMRYRSAIATDEARLDVKASGFWGSRFQAAFFDVRVFNSLAASNQSSDLATVFRRHEQEKRRCYEERVREVEHGCFLPLVFSTSGGMGKGATSMYKRLASLLSTKRDTPYAVVMGWLRCALSFSLINSAVTCLRGSRSRSGHAMPVPSAVDLTVAEGRVPL